MVANQILFHVFENDIFFKIAGVENVFNHGFNVISKLSLFAEEIQINSMIHIIQQNDFFIMYY